MISGKYGTEYLKMNCNFITELNSRERVSQVTVLAANSTYQVSDQEVLAFYNLATSKTLTALEVGINCS